MKGKDYARLVARYLARTYKPFGAEVYVEVPLGKSIIGKNRRVDVVVRCDTRVLAIECKYQNVPGTTDEKIPYALQDVAAMWVPAVVAYGGSGWSEGVLQLLRASRYACMCEPDPKRLRPSQHTRELDHVVAAVFGWWDAILSEARQVRPGR